MILFLFLTHLGVGICLALLLIPHVVGVKFFRFNAGLGVTLFVIALAFRPEELELFPSAQRIILGSLAVSTLALLIYWLISGRLLAGLRPWLLRVAGIFGFVALVAQALILPSEIPISLTVVSFLTSAALLGSACTTMILGHWYLVLPSMDVSFLQSMVKFHIWSMLFRIVVVGIVVFLAIVNWGSPMMPGFQRYILSIEGVFFWQRILFGLCGPVVLAYLIFQTAKIRSTQSATGILYVDFFAVIVGELLAKYLLLATTVPV